MTIRDVIAQVDELRPNAFSNRAKIAWINSLEGRIQLNVLLTAHTEVKVYKEAEDMETQLLAAPPHDDIYIYWLIAQIDRANGEDDKYQNSMQVYNEAYGDFVRWFARTYAPAQGYQECVNIIRCADKCRVLGAPYYLTAYSIAVKQGFAGTEDEWLESLIGKSLELKYENDALWWSVEGADSWSTLFDISAVRDPVVEATLQAAQDSAEAAKASETAAGNSASAAATSEKNAKASETAAGNSASAAAASQKNAADSEVSAKAAQAAAEKARDEANEIAGGDFASKTEAQNMANAAEVNANAYTDQKIAAIPAPDVSGEINTHNTDTTAHNDVRLLITELTNRLNALANSDDTTLDQMAEVVAYIKDNRELIEQITTGKVSVTDIVDNLTTNVANKPLSAAQGVALKALIDAAAEEVTLEATVTTTWTASGDYFYQDIAVAGMTADDNPITDILPGNDNAANILYSEAICKVFRITTSANSIRVWATEAIATAFPIQMKVVR